VRSIERVERVELTKSARFRVYVDGSLEALMRLVSAVSHSANPVVLTVKRGDVCGKLEVEVRNADVTLYHVLVSEVKPAFDGDEWGVFFYYGDTAVLVRIGSQHFLAFDGKLYAFAAEETEEWLRKFNLLPTHLRCEGEEE
jgi:hypothetical protein